MDDDSYDLKATVVALTRADNPRRMAGSLTAAMDIEINGKTGKGVFHYAWDKRDVTQDALYTTANIADDMRECLGYDSPSANNDFCAVTSTRPHGDPDLVEQYNKEATETVTEMEY